jgi:hypothetical protein
MVEMSCPVHISAKFRLRNTANGDGEGVGLAVIVVAILYSSL